jgi:hypothetical protein
MTSQDLVFLFDVDNTLVDNDRVQNDLRKHLERESGPENRDRYWAIFEQLRTELGYGRLSRRSSALQRYPARRYVMVDDKLRILTAMKKIWGAQLTTVFPRQGHYALDPKIVAAYPPPDITIERIGDLVNYDLPILMGQKEQR